MNKKILSALFVAALILSIVPFAHAQTADIAALQAQIAKLTQMVQDLQNQLNAIIGKTSVGTVPPNPGPVNPPDKEKTDKGGGVSGVITLHSGTQVPCAIPLSLAYGERGDSVSLLQQTLKDEGSYSGPVTGYYGPLTQAGLKNFQGKQGLDQTGTVNDSTKNHVEQWLTRQYPNYCSTSSTPVMPPVIPPYKNVITVTSPMAGDNWQLGETHTITWNYPVYQTESSDNSSTNISVNGALRAFPLNAVTINLVPPQIPCGSYAPSSSNSSGIAYPCLQPTIKSYTIIENAPNSGSYSWTIPKDLPQAYTGKVTIMVWADSASGTSGTFLLGSGTVTTTNQPPVISGVSGPTTLNVGQQGTWAVNASDPENGTLSYSVLWGDENNSISAYGIAQYMMPPQQSATFTHVYNSAGTYQPKFTVTDSVGLNAQTSLSVVVGSTISNTSSTSLIINQNSSSTSSH